jgi:hypothetical protein
VADDDAAGGKQLLHHAETKREAEMQPHGMADNLGPEPIPDVAGARGVVIPPNDSPPPGDASAVGPTKLAVPRREAEFRFARDSPLDGTGFEPVWGFSCQVVVLVVTGSLFVAKAVLRPVACDRARGARGRGQGTETVAKLGGLSSSDACVSQRLDG